MRLQAFWEARWILAFLALLAIISGFFSAWAFWLFVLLFVVYPLSSGPVVRLWTALGLARDPILGFYTPLVFVAFYFSGFRSLFMWYLDLWKANLVS